MNFKPDFIFDHYSDIEPKWLKNNNINLILSDIDSTLAEHNGFGDDKLNVWISNLKASNIELICVSNNSLKRADSFSEFHNVISIGKCNKPSTQIIKKNVLNAKLADGYSLDNIVILGDQLFTDVWCGKNLGIKTILVNPIGERQPINIRFKRVIEKWYLKKHNYI